MIDNICVLNACTCEYGDGATGIDCPIDGAALCVSCDDGFVLESGVCPDILAGNPHDGENCEYFGLNDGQRGSYFTDRVQLAYSYDVNETAWRLTASGSGGNQWMRWQSTTFRNKRFRATFQTKLLADRTDTGTDGLNVDGTHYDQWLKNAIQQVGNWTDSEVIARHPNSGTPVVFLQFDSAPVDVLIKDLILSFCDVRTTCGNDTALLINPPELSRSYNSVLLNNAPGTGWAQSMIDSPLCWAAKFLAAGQAMVLDLGFDQTIDGLAIQARAASSQMVTSYFVQTWKEGETSDDAVDVDNKHIYNGYPILNLDGQYNEVFFMGSVVGRYFKIVVRTWNNYISMRAGAIQCPTVNCDSGFTSINEVCVENVCTCSNGVGATGLTCITHAQEFCISCEAGFTNLNDVCVENTCTCTNGVGATGLDCALHESEFCVGCDDEFGFTETAFVLDSGMCRANNALILKVGTDNTVRVENN